MTNPASNYVTNRWGIKNLKVGDFLVVMALLAGAVAWIAFGMTPTNIGTTAVVEVSGKPVMELKLGHEYYATVQGALGPVLIGIDGAGVRILDSRCPNGLCKRMGPIRRSGDWIACIPNKLVIRIQGYSDVDAITPGTMRP
jgi:hypothetical protein